VQYGGRSDIESRDVLRSCVKYDAIGEEMIGGGGKFGGSEVEVVEDKWMSLGTPCPTKCRELKSYVLPFGFLKCFPWQVG
jgi:hypothetical protein